MDLKVSSERDAANVIVGMHAERIRWNRDYALDYVKVLYRVEIESVGGHLRCTQKKERGEEYYAAICYPKRCSCRLCLEMMEAVVLSFRDPELRGEGEVIHANLANAAACLRSFGGAKVHRRLQTGSLI